MRSLSVTIPGAPVGAGRPRVTRLRSGASHTYMPDKSTSWEASAILHIKAAWAGAPPMEGPVLLRLVAVCERPQRLKRRKDPTGRIWAPCKPDLDNVIKLAMDALVKGRAMVDDTQVVLMDPRKLYAALEPMEGPCVELHVEELA